MIDREHDLPISRQAEALGVSRGAVYYKPRPTSTEDLRIMRRLDELHLDYPFAGSRMLRDFLNREGVSLGRRHVTSLMKRIGIAAIYRRPNTSKPAPGHKIYPYLLRGVKIERADQVWAMDITYIPMARGFVYLAAVVDVFSRRVLAHRVSITMEADFCIEALEEALAKRGKPDIFNSDQGSRPKQAKLARNAASRTYVEERLAGVVVAPSGVPVPGPVVSWKSRRHGPRKDGRWANAWSPEQIARGLPADFPDDATMRISHEAIYQALFVQGRGALRRELTACLRTGRVLRIPRARTRGRGKTFISPEIMISQRPAEAADRAVPGHWEGDLIQGLGSSAIGTLVERTTRSSPASTLPACC